MTDPVAPAAPEQPQPEQQQQQYMAVPVPLMAAAIKILSGLPYEDVAAIIPSLTQCAPVTLGEREPGPTP